MSTNRNARGFTLLEIIIALALLTGISLFLLNALTPWMAFKQKLDTDRKLMEMKSLITTVYERNAWMVETRADAAFAFAGGTLFPSTINANNNCQSQVTALSALSTYFTDGLPQGELDGYANPFCILISPRLSLTQNGVTLYYHNIAIVSAGRDTRLQSSISAAGALTLVGDDTGILVNGYTIHQQKYKETAARLARVASLYEAYFTTRFLNNAARDVTIDYFANSGASGAWDSAGSVPSTAGAFQAARTTLATLGLGPEEGTSSYETNNVLGVGNYNECLPAPASVCVRSSVAGNQPPFTAVLYAPLPGPANNYLVKIATGNY